MYPVQYLHNKTTTGVPGPGPTVKLVGTMVQDSVKKKEGKKSNVPKGNKQIHMLLKKKLLEAVLKHKHLETVSKHKYRSMQKKRGGSVQAKEKIETYTTPNCLYISKPARKRGRKGKLGHKAGQQRTI